MKTSVSRYWVVALLIAAGIICMFSLCYCYAWVPGLLFVLSAVVWGLFFYKGLREEADTFDKKLAAGVREQIGVLVSIVSIAFLFLAGLVLMSRPEFSDVKKQSPFSVFLHVAHRFAGYNYYDDSVGVNFALLVISVLGAVFMGGFLITTLSNIVQQKKEDFLSGLITYKRIKNHIIILGYNDVAITLCRELLEGNGMRIIILTSQNLSRIRSILRSRLTGGQYERIVLYSGNMDGTENLQRLGINDCAGIYILGEQNVPGHDSVCLATVKRICGLLDDNRNGLLSVYLQMDSQSAFSMLQKLNVPDTYTSRQTEDGIQKRLIDLRPFNLYENQARLLWGYYKEKDAWELDYSDLLGPVLIPGSPKRVHLVIAGFDRMGQALLLEALRICHYPNFDEETKHNKTHIMVLDKRMDSIWPQFHSQYPHLGEIEDIEMECLSESLESPTVRERLEEYARDENALLTVAICFWDADNSFAAGLSLPDSLYFQVKDGVGVNNGHVRILIRNEYSSGIPDVISSDSARYRNVRFFGSVEEGLSSKLLDDKAAILQGAHFDTAFKPADGSPKRRIYDELRKETGAESSILLSYKEGKLDGQQTLDWARQFWNETLENHRFSNRYQIEMYGIFGRYLPILQSAFAQDCDRLISQMEHRRWCAERYIMGYRYEGYSSAMPIKKEKDRWRVHSDLVSFNKLEHQEKAKDLVHLTIDTINEIVSKLSRS